ncbi:Glycosyl transferase family 11 [Lachnospiraceae bacterium]|nr:Glycosyl transferase family 11 [Lachnospiraceae bacterium]
MIVLRFTSGLGNQMFQYAFYNYLRKKYPEERVLADISWFTWNQAHQGFELTRLFERPENTAFKLERASTFDTWCCSGTVPQKNKLMRYFNRITRLFAGRHFENIHYYETGRENEDSLKARIDSLPKGKNAYITGYFLNEAYYKDELTDIRRALSFDLSDIGEENEKLLRELDKENSVAIHVRRGDYLAPGYTENFINLGMDYYRSAVERAKKDIPDPKFFIFSDDKEYIQTAFNWLDNVTVVNGNTGKNSYLDMALMSHARALITANSTFSEWAGLLNNRENALVIYPKAYLKDHDSNVWTIPGWVRV